MPCTVNAMRSSTIACSREVPACSRLSAVWQAAWRLPSAGAAWRFGSAGRWPATLMQLDSCDCRPAADTTGQRSACALLPLPARLPPDFQRLAFIGRWQLPHAQQRTAELACNHLRILVVFGDGVDHLVPTQRIERPVDGCDRRLRCVALAPAGPADAPADLGAGPV